MSTADLELKGRVVLFPMTSAQFLDLPPSESVKLELLDGEVIMSPRPTSYHQYFVFQLMAVIEQWVRSRRLGSLLPDTLVNLGADWTPAPDFVFVSTEHLHRVKKKNIVGPVDLAVEVLSPSHPETDRVTKFEAYARFGIPWYWVVDLESRVLEEYALVARSYADKVEVHFDKAFSPRLFPGLSIDLSALEWREPQ